MNTKITRQRFLLVGGIILLISAVFCAYSGIYSHQFLFDDEFLIQKNEFLRSWSTLLDIFRSSSTTGSGGVDSFYRPMQTLCYLFVFQICGLSTVGFHLLNLILHALNACLVFVLGRRLGFHTIFALAAALLWSVHPAHTEAVTYMSATADTLYTLFCLLACVVLLPDFSVKRVGLACACMALGLMSKESAIVLPALALACRFAVVDREKRWTWRTYVFSWPLWITALFYLFARKTFLNFDNTFQFYKQANVYSESIFVRFNTFLATLPAYAQILLWPTGLHMEREFPVFTQFFWSPVVFGFLLALVSIGILVWGCVGPAALPLAWGILWFWSAHAPHTGVLLPVNAFILEHWLYLPSIGLLLGVFGYLGNIWPARLDFRWNVSAVGLVVICAIALGARTFDQNTVWSDPIRFYSNILQFNPRSARVHNNIAMAYNEAGNVAEAMNHYRTAIAIADQYPQTHYNLALLLISTDQKEEAMKHLRRAIEIDRNFYHAYGRLYVLYMADHKDAEAAAYYQGYLDARKRLGF